LWYATGGSNKWQFTTYERDGETGYDYAMARLNAIEVGRFTRPDPIGGSLGDPQSLNRYPYVRGNPINFVDPLGLADAKYDSVYPTGYSHSVKFIYSSGLPWTAVDQAAFINEMLWRSALNTWAHHVRTFSRGLWRAGQALGHGGNRLGMGLCKAGIPTLTYALKDFTTTAGWGWDVNIPIYGELSYHAGQTYGLGMDRVGQAYKQSTSSNGVGAGPSASAFIFGSLSTAPTAQSLEGRSTAVATSLGEVTVYGLDNSVTPVTNFQTLEVNMGFGGGLPFTISSVSDATATSVQRTPSEICDYYFGND
jgi:RHS repeat-associated protein